MSTLGKITRRAFMLGGAAVAGGFAVGYWAYNRELANPLKDGLPEGDSTLNPYVIITATEIILIAPRADTGQGVYSALAALTAEELDVDLASVRIEHGPPSATYYNAAMLEEGLPFLITDQSWVVGAARSAASVGAKFLGLQGTGGSSSIPDGYDKMRRAGATARHMLMQAAAQKADVPMAQLKTASGKVLTPAGKAFSYHELAALAATMTPPSDVTLKPAKDWTQVGKRHGRADMKDKLTAKALYTIDMDLPDMVFATVVMNPKLEGPLSALDDGAAKASKGVLKVVPLKGAVGVIADSTWAAFRAAKLLKPTWGESPYPYTSSADMWTAVEGSFVEDKLDGEKRSDGDVEGAFAAAGGQVIEARYKVPFLAHAPLEPMDAVAKVDGDSLELWVCTQLPTMIESLCQEWTGFPAENIKVHVLIGGGSFGRRLEPDYAEQVVALAKAMPGKPVKMVWTREQDTTHDPCRPMAMGIAKGKVADGKVVAVDFQTAAPSVIGSQMPRVGVSVPGPDISIVAGIWEQPFAVPNYRARGYRVEPLIPISSWRSVGSSVNGFFFGSFMDELAYAAGVDPLENLIALCNYEPGKKVLEEVKALSGWTGPKMAADRARGVAFCLSFGACVAEVVEVVKVGDAIKVDKVYVVAEVGKIIAPDNFYNQMEGGVIWGLGHAMLAEITIADSAIQQTNFHDFPSIRLPSSPEVIAKGLENGDKVRGIGEPPVPPAAAALANAIYALTGQRHRELPLSKAVTFV